MANEPKRGQLLERIGRWWGRGAGPDSEADRPQPRFRTVCIAREAGAGGSSIGLATAAKLGWRFFDQELVETIAQRMEIPPAEAIALDELASTRVQAWALPLWEEHYAPHEAYLDHLGKLIEAIGRAGDSVIVGRGAGFALPRDQILSVRVVASLQVRAARLAERHGVSARTARRMARDLDRRRNRFAQVQLGVDPRSLAAYDLVLDSERLGIPLAAELIVHAVELGRPAASLTARSLPAPGPQLTIAEEL